jgi:hypothetical protein
MPKKFKTKKEYNEWFKKYRDKNREKIRKYNREYNRIWRRDFGYQNETNSTNRYPIKKYARYLFHKALNNGIIKKHNCKICGSEKSQGHHNNYYKPLRVIWLCALHHTEYHKKHQNLTKS